MQPKEYDDNPVQLQHDSADVLTCEDDNILVQNTFFDQVEAVHKEWAILKSNSKKVVPRFAGAAGHMAGQ